MLIAGWAAYRRWLPLGSSQATDRAGEVVDAKRLRDHRRIRRKFLPGTPRQKGRGRAEATLLDLRDQRQPLLVAEVDVEQDHVDHAVLERLRGSVERSRLDDRVALELEGG